MALFPGSSKGGGKGVGFPDVCKTPAPPAPFAPIPYPNSQYQANLQKANRVDAQAAAGNKKAQKKQMQAIASYNKAAGSNEAGTLKGVVSHVKSAGQAVRAGYVLHKGAVGAPTKGEINAIKMTTTRD